jgi:hypothetical protein
VTIAEQIAQIEALLAERGRLDFAEALATATSRLAVVVTFLAILELWHRRRVLVEQEQLFGPISILPDPRWGQSEDKDLAEEDDAPGHEPAEQPISTDMTTRPARARRQRAPAADSAPPG